jgi:hypothetical protein
MDTGSNDMNEHIETFHNVVTGEIIIRELTPEEIAALPEPEAPEEPA